MGIGPACAQVPDQPNTSASPPATAATPADVLKRARLAGYRPRKLLQGTTVSTVYCKHEMHVGSRFASESCIDETQLEEFLLRAQSQRDSLDHRRGSGTDYH
jgi:hypothetical protein